MRIRHSTLLLESTLCLVGILHLRVLVLLSLALGGHLGSGGGGSGLLLLSLLDSFLLGTLLGGGLFLSLEGGLTLLLELVEVALGNGTTNGADLVDLGLVDSLGGVIALIVEPVLGVESVLDPKNKFTVNLPRWPQASPSA